MNKQDPKHNLRCYITAPYQCSYLPAQEVQNLMIDPAHPITNSMLGELLNLGFRRSGTHIYRPQCEYCQDCISLRIPAQEFRPNRSQQRNWRKNDLLEHRVTAPEFNQEQYDLYQRYISHRHPGSEMNNPSPDDYLGFLTAPNIDTRFHEFRLKGKLIAVSVTDHTPQGLSAVYTFFCPNHANMGLGTYAILWQINQARELGLPWVYLGYWIKNCDKMRYKYKFRPCQGYIKGHWHVMAK